MTSEQQGTGDELWDEFVREFHKSKVIQEPSAADRGQAHPGAAGGRRRSALLATASAGVVAAVVAVLVWAVPSGNGKGLAAAPATTPASPVASASPAVSTSASATGGSAAAVAPAHVTSSGSAAAVTAAQAFPLRVAGYTRVASVSDKTCTGTDTVGPTLAGMITQGHGCRGVAIALYRDAAGDEFGIDVFSMKDPADAAQIVFALSSNPTDYEVAVQIPPANSGLRALPADSGLVQAFAGSKRLAVVGLAQWADGRSQDFQALTDKLSPLLDAVTKQAGSQAGA